MFKKLFSLTGLLVLVLAIAVPTSSAAVGPISGITADNPNGSPPYNILSITVGNYTVTVDRLGVATSTHGSIGGTATPEMEDFDINTALNWNLGPGNYWLVNFGGGLWKDSNGDNPDFFLFESGGDAGDDPDIAPIFPDGTVGTAIDIPGSNWGGIGYNRVAAAANDAVDMDGQELHGLSFAITDLQDASGNPLTNDTVILGLWISDRGGADPVGFFAVIPPVVQAQEPNPEDEAIDVRREVFLSWTSGETAIKHDVYIGDVFEDVNNANNSSPLLVSPGQILNTYDPPELLEFGKTYYWRIDEIATDGTTYKGEVWSFTVEPFAYPIEDIIATASSNAQGQEPVNTVNGSGLDESGLLHGNDSDDAMWASSLTGDQPSWIAYEFDQLYKLHDMLIWNYNESWEQSLGVGIKEAVIEYSGDGVDYTILGTTHEFNQGLSTVDYEHNTIIDLEGMSAKHVKITANSNWGEGILNQYGLSEVRISYIPVAAREPSPVSGANDVDVDVVLGWRAGREAALHDVYLSDDPSTLTLADSVNVPVFDTASQALALGQTYYWRIDEVNEAEIPTNWQGEVWSFATVDFIVVDDFEDYDVSNKEIWWIWKDGLGYAAVDNKPAYPGNGTGSAVGDETSPSYMEETIVHGGSKSMPVAYNNSAATTSEVIVQTSDLPIGPNWTKGAAQTLVLWFYGDSANAATERMYVKINDEKVDYPGAAEDITRPIWQQWNIDLTALSIDLSNVTEFIIGFERTIAFGGSGKVLFDDIHLYRLAPSAAAEQIWIEAEAATTMGQSWRLYDDAGASGGKYLGSEDGDGDDNNDPPEDVWLATYDFTVSGGVYKILARIITSPGNSFWFRIQGATSEQITREDGWINTNPMDDGDTWHWDEIHNDQQDDNIVYFTLEAGQHTLEVAKREDGTILDAVLITDDVD